MDIGDDVAVSFQLCNTIHLTVGESQESLHVVLEEHKGEGRLTATDKDNVMANRVGQECGNLLVGPPSIHHLRNDLLFFVTVL
jgi:hypothetical protein